MKKSKNFSKLCNQIKDIETQLDNDNIKIIPIKKGTKEPDCKDFYNENKTFPNIKSHKGNFGIILWHREQMEKGLSVIDIDGWTPTKKDLEKPKFKDLKDNPTKYKEETKDLIFNYFKDIDGAIQVKTQSGGYHIYLWNETPNSSRHETSKNLHFPSDFPIEELRGESLNQSIEIFSAKKNRYIMLPPSEVNGKKYEVIGDINKLSEIKTVPDINQTVKKHLINKGFSYSERKHKLKQKKQTRRHNDKPSIANNESIVEKLKPYWIDGNRHDLRFALTGLLCKNDYTETDTRVILEQLMVNELKQDYKKENKIINDVIKAVYTYADKNGKESVVGWEKFTEIVTDENVLECFGELFGDDWKQYFKYSLPKTLLDKGWRSNKDGVYVPTEYDYFLHIKKVNNVFEYSWSEKIQNQSEASKLMFKDKTPSYQSKKPITKEDGKRNSKLGQYTVDYKLNRGKHEIKNFLIKTIEELLDANAPKILLLNDYEYKQEYKQNIPEEEEIDIVEDRKHPQFNIQSTYEFIEMLKTDYNGSIIEFLKPTISHMIIDEESNVIKSHLIDLGTVTGNFSYMVCTVGSAGVGKTELDEISKALLPLEYVKSVDGMTKASFENEHRDNPHLYDGVIIYLGDLGEKNEVELNEIFQILKRIVTEKTYKKNKNRKDKNGNYVVEKIEINGNISVHYGTPRTSETNDITNQKSSRTISSTPNNHRSDVILDFVQKRKTVGTSEHFFYNQAKQIIEEYYFEFLKASVDYWYTKKDHIQLFSPFNNAFLNATPNRTTKTREPTQIRDVCDMLTYFNYLCSHKVKAKIPIPNLKGEIEKTKDMTYMFPCLKDVNYVINLMLDSVGIPKTERNLLLKLIKIYDSMGEKKKNDIIMNIVKEYDKNQKVGEILSNPPKHKLEYPELFLEDIAQYVVKDLLLNERTTDTDTNTEKFYFFTTPSLKQKIKNSREYKQLDDFNDALKHLYSLGYIGKLENKVKSGNREYNVYYLNSICDDIKTTYKTNNEDIIYALNTLFTLIRKNPADRSSEYLWGFEDLKDVFVDYTSGLDLKTLKKDIRNCEEDGLKIHNVLKEKLLNLC